MRKLVFIALISTLSCAGIPEIITSDAYNEKEAIKRCLVPFLKNDRRLVHSINADIPGGAKATVLGVVLASPGKKYLHPVLMTVEGLVIFEAHYDGKVRIIRGIRPFDSKSFAAGMIDDIRLMLFPPTGKPALTGQLKNGNYICRYKNENSITDYIALTGNSWQIFLYDLKGSIIKDVRLYGINKNSIARKIEIFSKKTVKYSLHLELVREEPVNK